MGDISTLRSAATIGALVLAMALCARTAWRGDRSAALALFLLSFAWLTIDRDFEGTVLVTLVQQRIGITAADPVGFLGGIVSVLALVHNRRRRL